MPAYSFTKQFAPLVQSGKKRQTVRRDDKEVHEGDVLEFYTAGKTRKLLREATCIRVAKVNIFQPVLYIDGELFENGLAEAFARADGFKSFATMRNWIDRRYGVPFEGVVVYW